MKIYNSKYELIGVITWFSYVRIARTLIPTNFIKFADIVFYIFMVLVFYLVFKDRKLKNISNISWAIPAILVIVIFLINIMLNSKY